MRKSLKLGCGAILLFAVAFCVFIGICARYNAKHSVAGDDVSKSRSVSTTPIYHPKPDEIWPLIAQSHIIVTGEISVPVDKIRACQNSNQHEYVEIHVVRDVNLKGNAPPIFSLKWYTEPCDYLPRAEKIISLDGKKAILFIVTANDGYGHGFYFAGYTQQALSELNVDLFKKVTETIEGHNRTLKEFKETLSSRNDPLLEKVRTLIDATTRKKTQMDAFSQLQRLGADAVPAIIVLMDDRRDLAVPSISLENPPDHWEGLRHYGPKKVVDAMAAILNQITGENFGDIYNGGSEQERQEAINGWRIYLYHWKKEMSDKTQDDRK